MLYSILADAVLLFHLAFIVFVGAGGLLVLWWKRAMWVHLPLAAWGVWIELSGDICPLTPLENWLRIRGGAAGYTGDFIGQYLLWLLYPSGLTREIQIILGAIVVGINIGIYGYLFFTKKKFRIDCIGK